ncbi:hypothetical protein EDD16DRAFT_1652501 [Pisolithus croceorrhizus]|nr:hypothetical protein EDD16DRAFT_1652501 [Pisolithus croceorrhizus]
MSVVNDDAYTRVSPKSTTIRPLGEDLKHYLESDSIFIPEGSEGVPVESTLSDGGDDEREDSSCSWQPACSIW